MRLTVYEIKKLIGYRAFLFIAAVCLVLAGFSEINHIRTNDTSPRDYEQLAEDISDMSYDESVDYINGQLNLLFDGASKYDGKVLYSALEQLNRINGYEEYINSVDEQCSSITSFSLLADKGSFAYKNALKTKSAYSNVSIRELPFDVSQGVENVLVNSISDILMLFVLFSLAVFVFTKDKECGMMNLLYSYPNGRSRLCISKLGVMIIAAFILEFFFMGELLIINGLTYGFGDLSRPIQSVNGFMECSENFSVFQYMLINFVSKWLGFAAWAILFSLICIFSSNSAQIYGISLIVVISEIVMYNRISRVTKLGLLHDLNIFSFIKPDNIFASYRNLNIFGEPFNTAIVIPIVWFILISALVVSAVIVFSHSGNHEYKKLSLFKKCNHSEKVHGRVFYALKKSFSFHGSLGVIAIWTIVVLAYHLSFSKPMILTDFYYKQYTEQAKGTITKATDIMIAENEDYFSELDNKMTGQMTMSELNDYQSEQIKKEAFQQFSSRVEAIRNKNGTEIFYDTGYIRAFGIDESNEKNQLWILMLILCVLTVSPIIAYDKSRGLTAVIYSTSTGKKSYIKRCIGMTAIYSGFASAAVMIPYFANILRKYGTQGVSMPLQSIKYFAESALPLNIWQYALGILLIRLLILFLCNLVMLTVSHNSKSRFTATLINASLFIIPMLIMGFIK